MRRSDQRRDAVFASYQRDVTGRPLDELIADAKPLTRELAEGVDAEREELDETIAEYAKGWTVDRIAPLDLNVMRVALYEIEERGDPGRGGDRRGGRDRQGVLRRRRAEVHQRHPRRDRARAGAGQVSRLREIAERLREITAELEGDEAADERAAELAAEAADLSAEAVEEANRQAREAASAG